VHPSVAEGFKPPAMLLTLQLLAILQVTWLRVPWVIANDQ